MYCDTHFDSVEEVMIWNAVEAGDEENGYDVAVNFMVFGNGIAVRVEYYTVSGGDCDQFAERTFVKEMNTKRFNDLVHYAKDLAEAEYKRVSNK